MKYILLFTILFSLTLSAQKEDITKFADSIMNSKYKAEIPGAVLLIAKDGVPIYKMAFGMASLELNVPMNTQNVFRLASVSKQFTAICILQLAQEGKLSLNDDIRKFLHDYNSHGRIITIENLLYQTSGITSYTEKIDYDSVMTLPHSPAQIMKYFMDDSLLFEPGTDWSYSNSNYTLAGMIIEKVSGLKLGQYYTQHIFHPLQMTHTFLENRDSIVSGTVAGYEKTDSGKFVLAQFEDPSWGFGCGGLNSTIDDMLKWDKALYTDALLNSEWRNKAFTSLYLLNGQDTHYGAGFGVTNKDGVQYLEHGGSQHGFESDILRVPKNNLYIIVLSNNESSNLYDIPCSIAVRMMNISLPKPELKYPNIKKLAQDTGSFLIHHMYARVTWNFTQLKQYRTIFIKGDSLYSKSTDNESPELLLFISEDRFIGKESGMMYHFIRDEKRKVVSLEYYSEPLRYGPDDLEIKK